MIRYSELVTSDAVKFAYPVVVYFVMVVVEFTRVALKEVIAELVSSLRTCISSHPGVTIAGVVKNSQVELYTLVPFLTLQ